MKQYFKYLILGVVFGVIMSKSEIISWYRIYEMFHFDSFHMYGIIGSAVVLGMIMVYLMKRKNMKAIDGQAIKLVPKETGIPRYLIGGIIFGLGWALVGACPGPIFVLIGQGYLPVLVVLGGALIGTFVYGVARHKLPH